MVEDFKAWIGRSETASDVLEPSRSNALNAALGNVDERQVGDFLPPLHHWLYFWTVLPPHGLGADGHPSKGGFLPPVPLPRRMWAGGRLTFHAPLRLGEAVHKLSTILNVEPKTGKSGNLVFVTVQHRVSGPNGLAIVEEQDLVYREAATVGPNMPASDAPAPEAEWLEKLLPDSVLLFRYSALTMNGHRIHYDQPYALNEEAYPALVVHGPLQATMLASLAVRRLDRPLSHFEFRSQSPAFDGVPLHVCGQQDGAGAALWTEQGGTRAMVAKAG